MLASVFGYSGSQFRPEFLSAYLVVGAVGTVAQFVIVLAIFFAQAEVADAIENMKSSSKGTAAYIREKDRYASTSNTSPFNSYSSRVIPKRA